MDQKLEDIDPDARKKYDKDMKQQAKETLRRDALHLSDDDFGSKHGRDRTAKETAARSANETAGYKAAETDAKKELMQEGLRRASEPKSGGSGGAGTPKVGPKRTPEFKKGGKVSSASSRADGCAIRGKTRA